MTSQVYTNHGDDEYRVVSRERNGALIFACPDYNGQEHEHPEAQVSILFTGASASLLTHSETGKTVRTDWSLSLFRTFLHGSPIG